MVANASTENARPKDKIYTIIIVQCLGNFVDFYIPWCTFNYINLYIGVTANHLHSLVHRYGNVIFLVLDGVY